jgi:hypothetical protein
MKPAIMACYCLIKVTAAFAQQPDVQVVASSQEGVITILASHKIGAPPQPVWSILTDCPGGRRILPHFESCRILSRDPSGKWDLREHVLNPPMLPRIRTVARNQFDAPRRLSFKLVEGDLRVSEGTWNLIPDGKTTRLQYEARVAPAFAIPQFMLESVIRRDLIYMLLAIEEAALSVAEHGLETPRHSIR